MAVVYANAEWVQQVRLLIGDTTAPYLLSDANMHQVYAIEGDNLKRAAAQCLDIIASSEALVSKKIQTQDLATDGPAVAKALREHAALLRAQADKADADAAPPAVDDFGFIAFEAY